MKKEIKNLTEQLDSLLGKSKPEKFECCIGVSQNGDSYLIHSKPNLFDGDIFDGSSLEENLTNYKNIPKEVGIYNCDIFVHCFQCNRPDDPVEYDSNIWMENIKPVTI